MRCPEIRAFLHPFLDGELDVEKNVVVLQHLELCGCCRDRFEGEKRLLVRVREGITERCPNALRARMYAACDTIVVGGAEPTPARPLVPVASPAHPRARRGYVIPWPRLLASAAAVVVVFVGLDPLCFFGCPTVKALTREFHKNETNPLALGGGDQDQLAAKLSALTGSHVEVPHFCKHCCDVTCEGGQPMHIGDSSCMIRFRDEQKRAFTFVQARGVSIHPMLRGQDGLYVGREGESCFVGWREDTGELCGLVADEPALPLERLVALAAVVRAHEHMQK